MERAIGNGQNVPGLLGDDLQRRGHARVEELLGIGRGNDRRVGDDVLHRFRRPAHLDDPAVKDAVRIGVHGKLGGLALFDRSDIRFIDAAAHLHLTEIARDAKQGLRLQPCRDRLPRIDLAADDDAVDRRSNDGAPQFDLRLVENGLLFLDDGLGVSDVCERHLNVGLRDLDRVGFHFDLLERRAQLRLARVAGGARLADLAVGRRPGARQLEFPLEFEARFVAARLRRLRLRLRRFSFGLSRGDAELRPAQPRPLHFRQRRRNFERCARPAHPRFESAAVELRERLTRGHRIIEIHKDLVEQAGNGGPHIDLRDGLDGPRRFDRIVIAPRPTASNMARLISSRRCFTARA